VEEIAKARGFATSTIFGHLADALAAGETLDINAIVSLEEQKLIERAFEKVGLGSLGTVKELLGDRISYGQLRIFRAVRGG
jgi:ATP-dependent DNA helicase RecQ